MDKKAQGFSQLTKFLLAILVLFILILIFTGHFRSIGTDLESCASKGGNCISKETNCEGTIAFGTFSDCDKEKEKCCVRYTK